MVIAYADCRVCVYNGGTGYKIGKKPTDGYVSNIDQMKDGTKILVGTKNGNLSIYDYGKHELIEIKSYPHAHSASITGVSAHPTSPNQFTSCSSDRSCFIWDKAMLRPATRLLRDYENQLTAVHWTTQEESKQLVILGDEVGNILTVDPRCPNKVLSKKRVHNRGISKFSFNGTKRFGVITTQATIVEFDDDDFKVTLEHCPDNTIYSMCWDMQDKNTFYVVGDEQYIKSVTLDTI